MPSDRAPIILWFRRDLRLADHRALTAAAETGRPVIPVFILDYETAALGAAPKWRLGQGLERFAAALENKGSRLILRRGKAQEVLRKLIGETGAGAVYWSRLYDPDSIARDSAVKKALEDDGIEARSFAGHLVFEPWTVETESGGHYKVFSPMWKSVRNREIDAPLPEPGRLNAPESWPGSDALEDWKLGAAMNRGGAVVQDHCRPGEAAAQERFDWFMEEAAERYASRRDMVAQDATSGLSEYLSLGEISARRCWAVAQRDGGKGAETFRKELAWREFAYQLMYHTPRILSGNWREEWDGFPWNEDERFREVQRWKHARTGVRLVDAGLREMYVTGRMHNRARMIVASYLTKHLMCHWKIGMDWFADCLIDWDPASNAMGWQWVAGSGPDAAPYFRVFNPETQAQKFDPDETYLKRWIAEGQDDPGAEALSYFDAVPRSWNLSPDDPYPEPVVGLKEGREAALAAYQQRRS